jgi:hypothetical protein
MTIEELFDKYEDEYLKFDRIEKKFSNRPDLHAFILLDQLMPGTSDMVSAAGHDIIYLDIDAEKFLEIATEDIIRDLSRCGVHVDEDSLALYA